jgi:hypothetical protein
MAVQGALSRILGTLISYSGYGKKVEESTSTEVEPPRLTFGTFYRDSVRSSSEITDEDVKEDETDLEVYNPLRFGTANTAVHEEELAITGSSASRHGTKVNRLREKIFRRITATDANSEIVPESRHLLQIGSLARKVSSRISLLAKEEESGDSETEQSSASRTKIQFGKMSKKSERTLDVEATEESTESAGSLVRNQRLRFGSLSNQMTRFHFRDTDSESLESREPMGIIKRDDQGKVIFGKPGVPEATRIDVYFGPLARPAERHYEKGNIRDGLRTRMLICNKRAFPSGREFGLFENFRDQLKSAGSRIGFTVFMNGINVTKDEFISYGDTIYSKINKKTLAIGLYNKSGGFVKDCGRVFAEKVFRNCTDSIRAMALFLETVTDHLYHERRGVRLQAPFLMIVHSEGGLILHRAIHSLGKKNPIRSLLKAHMYVITLGSVRPIPDRYGARVINIYSKKDHVTNPFAQNYDDESDDDNGYTIKHVSCTSDADERIARLIDHGFLSDTYQKHLKGQIDQLEGIVGFGS